MKYLARLFAVLSLAVACVFAWSGDLAAVAAPSPILAEAEYVAPNAADSKLATDFGKKIDLNNTNLRKFRKLRGMYPTLAGLIVQNAPYSSVDDIFAIEGLSERQKATLESHRKSFTVSPPEDFLIEGDERYNNGIY
ncbi:MAG: photosystem II complex extrinsic protein PsbU [Geitlerinemataceae cyanobacterium]